MSAKTLAEREATEFVDRSRLAAVAAAGHELVGLMVPGDDMFCSGAWRMIRTTAPASGGRVHLVMSDGSEFVAEPTATRRHRRIADEADQ